MVDEIMLDAVAPFESVDDDEHHIYQTIFKDSEGKGIIVDPRSVMRMRIERVEVA